MKKILCTILLGLEWWMFVFVFFIVAWVAVSMFIMFVYGDDSNEIWNFSMISVGIGSILLFVGLPVVILAAFGTRADNAS